MASEISKNFSEVRFTNRKQPRLKVDIPGFLLKSGDEFRNKCNIINIGVLGLGLEYKGVLVRGDLVEVEFILNGVKLNFRCKVAHISGKFLGLTFQDINQEETTFIRDIVHANFFNRKNSIDQKE